ncbi:MAG: amidohydrolase [Deltaproteobacteria bacterium]|nr:amidohydrolase [Deltaproteobacteria bacterium]NIS76353.1 amidohydrolase [Deltaproteobacteria bacterium]
MEVIEKIAAEAKSIERELFALVTFLYENPEVSFEEHRTSQTLKDFLRKEGFAVKGGTAGLETAFVAKKSRGKKNPRVGFLVEMDALPQIGHACGHNVVAAASSGAAVVLSRIAGSMGIAGSILCFGTPAEESGFGKVKLAGEGVFDGLDAAMMVHPSSRRVVDKEYLALKKMTVTFRGKAAHAAAYPEQGVNALDALILFFNSVGLLRQQLAEDVRVHGIITEGGVAPNIIPERTSAYFYVRARSVATAEDAAEKLRACARGAAKASGCRVSVKDIYFTLEPMRINAVLAAVYREGMAKIGLREDRVPRDKNLGSSDIGNVSTRAPAIQPLVPIVRGKRVEIHTHDFREATVGAGGRRGMMEGVVLLAYTGYRVMTDPALRKRVKKAFREGNQSG